MIDLSYATSLLTLIEVASAAQAVNNSLHRMEFWDSAADFGDFLIPNADDAGIAERLEYFSDELDYEGWHSLPDGWDRAKHFTFGRTDCMRVQVDAADVMWTAYPKNSDVSIEIETQSLSKSELEQIQQELLPLATPEQQARLYEINAVRERVIDLTNVGQL